MFHYLFTNDLRISVLDESLKKAGYCFATNTVPSSAEDKSANNNMMTLGFYFNLIDGSNCAKVAAAGDVRSVVLNFIKKFQFPNMRTTAAYKECHDDGIMLAPMRIIVKVLYTMNLMHGSLVAHLSKEEIKYFIFYNEKVAKTKHPDINQLISDILDYRKSGTYPEYVDTDENNHEWKHEDRQIREMLKVLQWSGCVAEKEGVFVIDNDNLSRSNKADVFDIISCDTFWDGSTVESYRAYMDLESADISDEPSSPDLVSFDDDNEYKRAAKVLTDFISESGFENPITSENVESVRNTFVERYNPERLAAIPDSELLDAMYYTEGDNSDSLCCFIEMNKECRSIFGSIAGGSAYKFGLFKKKETGEWTSGSPIKPIVLSDAEALERGKEIRDALVKGVQIIKEATLDSLEAYEQLDDDLRAGVGEQFYNWTWFHKYFAIICSDKLSCYHNSEWQNHVLYCFGIKPSSKYYARSGQIAMIENYAGLYYRQFFAAHVERFGRPITFFRIGTSGEDKNYAPEWIKRKVVGIGWNGLGSLKEYETADSLSKDDITDKLVELYYEDDRRTASRKAGELVRFYSTDDASVLVAADGERLLGLVDELGVYFYDASAGMAHLKPGKWHTVFGEEEKMPNKAEGLQTSCVQIKDEENLMFLYKKYYYGEDQDIVEEEDVMEEEQKLKTCLEVDREPRENALYPMNFIIYGAPGTGKTYSTAAYAIGIITGKTFEEVKAEYAGDRKRLMADYKKLVRSGQVVFTTFHQSYGYEEFIQGLRPDTKSEKMSFKTVDGVFKRIADVALNDEENNYVIIIDEINRANISKVFGELITLIETDKRWGELNETSATLQSGDPFAVPNNLYIVGTMNSADKSISLIDAALRRRFDFIEQKPEVDLIADPKLRGVLKSLNTSLADELDSSDLLIGHSYFLGKTVQDLPTILNNSIIPLLYEYFYDNKKKVSSVLSLSVDGIEIEIIDDKMGRLSVKKPE